MNDLHYPRGFLPFPITPLTTAQFAALASNFKAFYPVAVPLSQVCKWYWLSKSWTAAWSASWKVDAGIFVRTGSDAFSGVIPDSQTQVNDPNFAATLATTASPARVIDYRYLDSVLDFESQLQFYLSSPGSSTNTPFGGPPVTSPYTANFSFLLFNGIPAALKQEAFAIQLTDGTKGFYPRMRLMMLSAPYTWDSTKIGSAVATGSAVVDGITIPMFSSTPTTSADSFLTVSAAISLTTTWS